jgi:hypothetical protein
MVWFAFDGADLLFPMLVDGGADDILLPRAFLAGLRIPEKECEDIRRGTLYGLQEGRKD